MKLTVPELAVCLYSKTGGRSRTPELSSVESSLHFKVYMTVILKGRFSLGCLGPGKLT
ncbi:hypothetical protein SLEP1_g53112 [Rubroshorea leprosula]|uniref:Uncharacterized protein n=1 Tax=Rubroshorea leprosula TaxID=152421 RepID=A0AAV5M8E3_9ROSI|nr:hypothetical protein SLEP1_g53112 [Rubroshorea leprosula]